MSHQTEPLVVPTLDETLTRIQQFIHSHDTLSRRNAQATANEGEALLAIAQTSPSFALYLPDLYLTLGVFYARSATYERAASYLYQAIPLLEARQDVAHLPSAWNYLGLVYSQVGDLEAALKALLKGVQVATEAGQVVRRASCLNDLAYLYIELGHPRRALQHLEESLSLLEPLTGREPQTLLAAVWDSLALCYVALEDYRRAEQFAYKAFAHAERYENPWGLTNVWQTLGQIALQQQAHHRAISAYAHAQVLAHQHGYTYQEAQALLHGGKAYMEQGDTITARTILTEGLALAETIGTKPILHRTHEALATLAEWDGDFASAYHHYKQFHHLRDEHYGERLEQRAKILTLLHELDSANQATKIAHEKNEALQQEIAERSRLQAILERLATIDDLTQLLNRRHFFTVVEQELQIAKKRTVGLLVMDVDHFKQINDRFGHEAGDFVLHEVAVRLSHIVGESGIVGRYGGEEFIIFLPDTDTHRAHTLATRVLKTIHGDPFMVSGEALTVTASIGVVALPAPVDRRHLFRCADQALYEAKAKGRNQVEMYVAP
jgi:diguanylate cyclase (GGDEF)-like protein